MDAQLEFILAREAQLIYRRAREFEPVGGSLTKWRGSIPGRLPSQNVNFEVEILIPPDFPRAPPQVIMVTPTDHPQVDPKTGIISLRILSSWRPDYHLYQVINSVKGLFARFPPKLPDTFASTLASRPPPVADVDEPAAPPLFRPPANPPAPESPAPSRPIKEEKPLIPEESPKISGLKSQICQLESELLTLQKSMIQKEEQVARLEGRMDAHNVPKQGPVSDIVMPKDPKENQLLDLQGERIALEDLIRTLEDKFECGEINSAEYASLYKSYQKQLFLIKQKLKELGITH